VKPWQKSVLGVVLILLIAYGSFSAYMGSLNPRDWTSAPAAAPSGGGTPPAQVLQNFQVELRDYGKNSLDATASLTDATNFALNWFGSRGGGYILLGSAAAATSTVEITPQDYGVIYAAVEPQSGQAYYVDAPTTKANNPRVQSWDYFDIDGDGYKEFVFKFSVANLEKPIGSNAVVYIYPYFIEYSAPRITTPGDITGIGTALNTTYIQWYLDFSASKKGVAVTKVEIEFNSTDQSLVTLSNVNIPGIGFKTGDTFTPFRGSSTYTYTYTISPNLNTADYLTLNTNQLNKFEFTTKLDCTFSANLNLTATINIYTLDQTGTPAALITSTINLSEA